MDFMEFPKVRGKTKSGPLTAEGQILVNQAADMTPARRLVPDQTTWLQCFSMYTAAITQDQPDRAAEPMAYEIIIAKSSQRYKWPSWVIYGATFRQEMAGVSGQSWARVDPSIYSLCFTRQAFGDTGAGLARRWIIPTRCAQPGRGRGRGMLPLAHRRTQ